MSDAGLTVQFAALHPLMDAHKQREISAAVAQAKAEGATYAVVDIGINHGSIKRAGLYFRQNISADDTAIDSGAGEAFVQAWSLGEREAMRRVMVALSSMEAKGREIEVLAALMDGASIIDALAGKKAAPVTESAKVVAFRPPPVTKAADDE